MDYTTLRLARAYHIDNALSAGLQGVRLSRKTLMHADIHFSISYKNLAKHIFHSFSNSISKFCNHKHQPGEYIFHAENDDAEFTKMFTLNIRSKLNYQEISC